jgi:hypothetical protein
VEPDKKVGRVRSAFQRRPRLAGWGALAASLIFLLWMFAPAQVPVILHKLAIVTLGAVVAYWLDRHAFPHARVGDLIDQGQTDPDFYPVISAAFIRRAIIIGAGMLAMANAL